MGQSSIESGVRAKLHRGAAAMAGGFLVRFGAKGLFLVTAAVLYGPVLFGAYAVAQATIEFCVAAAGLSVKKLLFRMLDDPAAETAPAERIADAAVMVIVSSAVIGAAIAVGLFVTGQAAGPVGRTLLLMLPMVMGQCLLDVCLTAIRWTGLVRYEVMTRSLVEPYVGLAAALLAYVGGMEEAGLAIGYAVGTLAALGQAAYGLRRAVDLAPLRRYRLSLRPVLPGIRANAANTMSDLAANLYQRIDLYIVALALGQHASGVYAMAKQFCIPIRNIRQSYDALVLPLMSRDLSGDAAQAAGGRVGEIIGMVLKIQLPYVLALAGLGATILHFFPASFHAALVPMILLAVGEALHASHGIAEYILAYRAPVRGLVNTLVSMAIGGLVAWLLVGAFGLPGAAAGMFVSYALRALLRSLVTRRLGFHVPYAAVFLRYLVPAVPAAAVLVAGRLLVPGDRFVVDAVATALALGVLFLGFRLPLVRASSA